MIEHRVRIQMQAINVPVDPTDFTIRVKTGPHVITQDGQAIPGDDKSKELVCSHVAIEVDGVLVWAGHHSEQGTAAEIERIASEIIVDGHVAMEER